jgi:hypothetical protein
MARLVRQLRYLYLAFFSKPAGDRRLYRHIRRHKSLRIMELGVGTLERSLRLIELANDAGTGQVSFTGIDLFEMRAEADGPGVSLKVAHRGLQASGAKVRLVPGNAQSALTRMANTMGPHDLVLISADQTDESLAQAWFYFPRILAEGATVFRQQATQDGSPPVWKEVTPDELRTLSQPPPRRRVA